MAWDQMEIEQMAGEAIASSRRAARLIHATPDREDPGVYSIVVSVADTPSGPKSFSHTLVWGLGDSYESLREEIRSWIVGLP